MSRDFFSDLDTDPMATSAETIRANAHIVNGGDASFPCPSCKGRGKFISYAGRVVGDCFKCKGKGQVGARVAGAAKAKATRAANVLAFREEHDAEVRYAHRRAEKSSFYAGLLEKLDAYGSWTPGQIVLIRKDMVADEEFRAKKQAEKTGEVDISAIEKLFAGAVENAIKRPIFRAEGIVISRASASGRNAGALYVKDNTDTYLGKIVNGTFHGAYAATPATIEAIRAVAVDPAGEAIKYGRKTGNCGLCGRGLVDPVSILQGIGPICSAKWQLDMDRDEARDEYAAMKAKEAGE